MAQFVYVSVLLMFVIPVAGCISCYTCIDVTNESVCIGNMTTCGTGQSCYKVTRVVHDTDLFTLGCMDNLQCSRVSGTGSIVGRDLNKRQTLTCKECCSTDLCNAQLCHHQKLYSDCSEIKLHEPNARDGVYDIVLWKSNRTIQVFCDMSTDNGGWTVFQNRYDGYVDFYRNYTQYVHGFGDLQTEFWLGLDYIQEMTTSTVNELRMDMTSSNGTTAFETFSLFSLSSPNYVLHVGNTTASRNIGSNTRFSPEHNGQAFTTYDLDVDHLSDNNCATAFHGAWWYNHCYTANLNGQYLIPGSTDERGIMYLSFIYHHSLKQTRMAFRRK